MKNFLYIAISFIVGALLTFAAITFFNAREQEQALTATKHYLAEHYPQLNYEILGIYPSTKFKHYGYFKYSLSIRDADKIEIFEVYYDKDMDRMEDSRKLRQEEEFLEYTIAPKVEHYVKQHFGETRYVTISYYMEIGKPMILVMFNEDDYAISQAECEQFVTYIKEELHLDHALVLVDYWMGESFFREEF